MKLLLFIFLLSVLNGFALDTTNCACCDIHHDQFNFWVAYWIDYDTAGNEIGKKQADGSVTQTWNIVDQDETVPRVLFHGVYRKISK